MIKFNSYKNLEAEETLRVDKGCLVAFQPSVLYDIQFVALVRNVLFGGEGLFYAKLIGPRYRLPPDIAIFPTCRSDYISFTVGWREGRV